MKQFRKLAAMLAAGAMIFTLTSCAGSSSAAASGSGTKVVNVGLTNSPANLDPFDYVDNATTWVTQILYLPLMDLDDDGKYKPQLADSVDTKDNTTFTVHLNKDAKWTDGQPVTADDVIFTVNAVTSPKTNSNLSTYFNLLAGTNNSGKNEAGGDTLSSVTKVDDHTVSFLLKSTASLNVFEDMVCKNLKTAPQHVFKDVPLTSLLTSSQAQAAAVTDGAFKLVSFQKGQYVQLAANPNYFRGAPKLSQLNFKVMQGSNITAELESGEIDMNWPGVGNVPVEDYDKVKAMKNLSIVPGKPWTIQYLFINNQNISDVNVRQAISYAIDRKSINQNLCKGDGEIIQLPFASDSTYLNKSVATPTYDPEKAKGLLKQSGFNKTLVFNVPTGNTTRESVCGLVASNLQAVGFKVQIQKYDFATVMSKLRKVDYDLTVVGNNTIPTNPYSMLSFLYEKGLDYNGYNNAEVNNLIQSAYTETDSAKIKQDYSRLQEILVDEMPSPALYCSYELIAVNKRVVTGKPKLYGMTINVQDWDVKG